MPRMSEGAQGLFKKPAPASHDRGVATLRLTFPFIAGQWSLQALVERLRNAVEGLNPLHCGAVVA